MYRRLEQPYRPLYEEQPPRPTLQTTTNPLPPIALPYTPTSYSRQYPPTYEPVTDIPVNTVPRIRTSPSVASSNVKSSPARRPYQSPERMKRAINNYPTSSSMNEEVMDHTYQPTWKYAPSGRTYIEVIGPEEELDNILRDRPTSYTMSNGRLFFEVDINGTQYDLYGNPLDNQLLSYLHHKYRYPSSFTFEQLESIFTSLEGMAMHAHTHYGQPLPSPPTR